MASDLISREKLVNELRYFDGYERSFAGQAALMKIIEAPAVDAIPIDTVAEMLAELFGDEIPCNYNDIDEVLSIGCEKAHCPDDGDHSCWKKYVEYWMKRKMDGGKQDEVV